jgi:predicted RNA binding protein YcfA (HicA-like mRNA interferase family)
MPKLPNLSGKEVIKALSKMGFVSARQKGSHVILTREQDTGKKAVVVPLHREIDREPCLRLFARVVSRKRSI